MTYSTNSVIDNEDYNNFVWGDPTGNNGVVVGNNINYMWGPGQANRGLNQDMESLEIPGLPQSPVSAVLADRKGKLQPVNAGDVVEAQSWIGFFASLNRMRYYQDGATGNLSMSPTPAQGRTISTFASVAAKMTSANVWFGSPVPNFGITTTSVSASKTAAINVGTTAVTVMREYSCKIEWPTGDHIRWFFNSGGRLRISFAGQTTGSPASLRSTSLVSTINGIGECYISAYTNDGFTGNDSGSNTGAGKGYWTLGTTSLQLGSNTLGAGAYSDSFITVYAYRADVSGNGLLNGAVGKSIVIVFRISSGFGGTGTATGPGGTPNWNTDNIDISAGITVDLIDQTGAGATVTKTWSNPTVGSLTLVASSG
jgi:hypothetical protein